MKKRYWVGGIFLVAGLLCIPASGFANSKIKAAAGAPQSSCVRCAFNPMGCRTCTGGGTGLFCETFNCGLCEEDGECALGIQSGKGTVQSAAVTDTQDKEPLRISSRVIREIGSVHPRFAITLAEMSGYGISPGEHRLYWTPIKFSSEDVERFLNKETNSKYFRRYNQDVRKLNRLIQKGELSDIVYRVSTKQTEEGSWSIRMQVTSDMAAASMVDPAYATLQMNVSASPAVQGAVGARSQKKETWQIQ